MGPRSELCAHKKKPFSSQHESKPTGQPVHGTTPPSSARLEAIM